MEIHTIGIDLGKTLFHLVGVDSRGTVVVRKRCSRAQLLAYTANIRVHRTGMEACSGSHFLGRALREQGHDVRLLPAQYVKPYVKTNKSDYIDADEIAEAVERPNMRFVPIKTKEQLDLQAAHRVRERWVMRRTAVVNQIRGLLPVQIRSGGLRAGHRWRSGVHRRSGREFFALDAATGDKLWSFQTGAGHRGSAVSYSVNGRQYVATPTGWQGTIFGSVAAALFPDASFRLGSTTVVFALPEGSTLPGALK